MLGQQTRHPAHVAPILPKSQIHTEQSTVRKEMIVLAAKQPKHRCMTSCNQTNRQKPKVDNREEVTAFLEQPHSSLTTPTPIMLGVGGEPCPLRTARLFRLKWATSLPGERVAHRCWRPRSPAIKEISSFQLYTNSSVAREKCDPCSSSRSDMLLRA